MKTFRELVEEFVMAHNKYLTKESELHLMGNFFDLPDELKSKVISMEKEVDVLGCKLLHLRQELISRCLEMHGYGISPYSGKIVVND